MRLKQVKEFTKKTVTQKIASKICSILVWNNFIEDKYLGTFEIDIEDNCVLIECPGCGNYNVKIDSDGKATAISIKGKHDSYETIVRNKETGDERIMYSKPLTHGSQISLIQCYIDYGFYILD